MRYQYNKPTEIPNSITHLTFGFMYNQPTKIPNSVTYLSFDNYYNQQTEIPNSINTPERKDTLVDFSLFVFLYLL